MSDASRKSISAKRKTVRARKWGYGYVLRVSVLLASASMIMNTLLLAQKGEEPVEANYAFRETLRATRRAKTLATYARKRGPMIQSVPEEYKPLSAPGLTHLEDGIGGFISGPLGLWKNDEVYAYSYHKNPDVTLTLTNLVESKAHWTNGNPDPCVDRKIYIGGQMVPQQMETDFIRLVIGFVNVNCSTSTQTGYVSMLKSRSHGGPLIGRIYKATAEFTLADFPADVTSSSVQPKVVLTEIGSVLESRKYTSEEQYDLMLVILLIPMVVWMFVFVRLSSVRVMLSVAISQGKGTAGGSTASKQSGLDSGRSDDQSTNSSENELKTNRKETTLSKYINPRIIELWRLPMLHMFYVITYVVIHQVKSFDEELVRAFIDLFDQIHLDFGLHASALASQEATAWLLSIYSFFIKDKKTLDLRSRAIIYTYQHSTGYLRILKALNVLMCICLTIKSFRLISLELGWTIVSILAGAIFLCEFTMVLNGFHKHPFDSTPACAIGGLGAGFSIATRQITNYLAEQNVKGLSGFDRDPNCVPGMEYVGTINDALVLGRPDYIMEGLINGQVIQVSVLGQPHKDNANHVVLENVGNHQFSLVRHWLHQGKQGIAIL